MNVFSQNSSCDVTRKQTTDKKKRIRIDKTVDTLSSEQASRSNHWRFPDEEAALDRMNGLDEEYWERVDPMRRGASEIVRKN